VEGVELQLQGVQSPCRNLKVSVQSHSFVSRPRLRWACLGGGAHVRVERRPTMMMMLWCSVRWI
jgi:hypothetical protein